MIVLSVQAVFHVDVNAVLFTHVFRFPVGSLVRVMVTLAVDSVEGSHLAVEVLTQQQDTFVKLPRFQVPHQQCPKNDRVWLDKVGSPVVMLCDLRGKWLS